MTQSLLKYSMFQEVFSPQDREFADGAQMKFALRRRVAFVPHSDLVVASIPTVVFDLETTGLDPSVEKIIEIGAIKYFKGQVQDQFESFVDPKKSLSKKIQQITGITPTMLEGQPEIAKVLPKFFRFIDGAILVAHNAAFDIGFLSSAARQLGYDLTWPVYCTMKLAREFLPDLRRKNLDTLADHYGLEFEKRHRSIGDAKVTLEVLKRLLKDHNESLCYWKDFAPFSN